MKKSIKLALSFLTCLVLFAGSTVYISGTEQYCNNYNNPLLQEMGLSFEEALEIFHFGNGMSLEEAKEKFFYYMDKYGVVCWVTRGIPLGFADEIDAAWLAVAPVIELTPYELRQLEEQAALLPENSILRVVFDDFGELALEVYETDETH